MLGDRALPVIEQSLEGARRHLRENASASDPDEVSQQIDDGLGRAPGQYEPRHSDEESLRRTRAPHDVGCKAVRRHDVEADGGHDHAFEVLGLGPPPAGHVDDCDFAGHVQVVGASAQTGVQERRSRCRKGPCRIEHDASPLQRAVQQAGIGKLCDAEFEIELRRQRSQFVLVAPAKHWHQALAPSLAGDQVPGVAGSSVDEERIGHRDGDTGAGARGRATANEPRPRTSRNPRDLREQPVRASLVTPRPHIPYGKGDR